MNTNEKMREALRGMCQMWESVCLAKGHDPEHVVEYLRAKEVLAETFKSEAQPECVNAQQIGGDHYRLKAIQPWDFIIANNISYLEGNAIKYLCRWREKNGLEDLRKAKHYIQKLIEVESQK